ncbi:MAG TPA: hypothetical protein PK904_05890 [Bacteroidales bacterium]|nr:hypothetical protein [Bacteroidales bacterium]
MRGTIPWIIFFLMLPVLLSAQFRRQQPSAYSNYFGISGEFGVTSFFGDLDESAAKDDPWSNNLAWQFQVLKNFNSLFELTGRVSIGNISGHKNMSSSVLLSNRYFKTKFTEYTFDASINLLGFFTATNKIPVAIYGKIGIGLIDFKTKVYSGVNDSLISTHGYDEKATTEMVIPFGLRIMYHASKSVAFSFSTTSSRVNTDKLDNVANNNNSDYYNYLAVGIVYKFFHDTSLIRLFGKNARKSTSRSPGRSNPSRRR